ncbi:hypothetical protein OVV29_34060, partial [Klebsiella pneumoniae]|nr:hypothetical protein [Klebsiella pneumoniae]
MRPQHFGGLAAPREFACPMRDVDQGHLRSSAMLVGWMMSQSGRNVRLHVRGGHGGKQRVRGAAADRDPRH